MGFYSYEVVDRMGRPGSGQMAADDEMIVAKKLRDLGLTVLDINEVRQSPFSTLFKKKPKVGIGDLAVFSRQLQTLLEAGIPALQALETAGPASGSIIVAEAVENTCEKIQKGKNIAGPLGESGVFAPMVVRMVAVGRIRNLPDMLSRVSGFYEEEVATMAKG